MMLKKANKPGLIQFKFCDMILFILFFGNREKYSHLLIKNAFI
jgi:hypothetical protein